MGRSQGQTTGLSELAAAAAAGCTSGAAALAGCTFEAVGSVDYTLGAVVPAGGTIAAALTLARRFSLVAWERMAAAAVAREVE